MTPPPPSIHPLPMGATRGQARSVGKRPRSRRTNQRAFAAAAEASVGGTQQATTASVHRRHCRCHHCGWVVDEYGRPFFPPASAAAGERAAPASVLYPATRPLVARQGRTARGSDRDEFSVQRGCGDLACVALRHTVDQLYSEGRSRKHPELASHENDSWYHKASFWGMSALAVCLGVLAPSTCSASSNPNALDSSLHLSGDCCRKLEEYIPWTLV